jgi:alpha,alpha-trehalase
MPVHSLFRLALAVGALAVCLPTLAFDPARTSPASPADLYGDLLVQVQMQHVLGDGKTFVDAVPRSAPRAVMAAYAAQKDRPGFSLADFVRTHFDLPADAQGFVPRAGQDLAGRIEALWPALTRAPVAASAIPAGSSLLPLPHPYVVPGGRFREVYYWDSYFTMLGLARSGRRALAESMVKNVADQIARYGHVPNGNRSYYLSRSQPPVFFKMVGALSPAVPEAAYVRYLPSLKREYAFWMDGSQGLRPGQARRRVVAMPDGSVLNRYWDDRATPREESYREDVLTARASGRPAAVVYRDLRAGAESGWDFSSRWLADGKTLASIETTSIVPIDLNALLYGLEEAIAAGCALLRDTACRDGYHARAEQRRKAVDRYLWDEARGYYVDYHHGRRAALPRLTAATVYPLFTGMAQERQAARVAERIRGDLLQRNGLATTLEETGQQWDAPNGWSPLQWMAVDGLGRYRHAALARDVAVRWMRGVERVYRDTGKLMEKYDVAGDRPGGGGEYPTQDGFGWTNGVMVELMARYPDALAPRARPGTPANRRRRTRRAGLRAGPAATGPRSAPGSRSWPRRPSAARRVPRALPAPGVRPGVFARLPRCGRHPAKC